MLAACALSGHAEQTHDYVPTPEILQARQEFSDNRFGIFLHWGIYSMFAQGEWFLNYGPTAEEYAKAASGFYPANFNAHDWECHEQGIKLHLYYSHIDWTRPDYPSGRTGLTTGRDSTLRDWPHYYDFMNRQLTELLTNYGEIGAIWFDGWWDHDEDAVPFDWQLPQQYKMIHDLQPSCLIGNNHHQTPFPGEDIQIFERDLPGENTAGLSGQDISRLPLETCQTMNGMWGYKIKDQDYKDTPTLIRYLVKAAGMGANMLMNIGPQPNGELPATALARLADIGKWMRKYGETYYATQAGDFKAQSWGTSTRKGDKLYIHIFEADSTDIFVPTTAKVKNAVAFDDRKKIKYTKSKEGITLHLDSVPDAIDYIVELNAPLK